MMCRRCVFAFLLLTLVVEVMAAAAQVSSSLFTPRAHLHTPSIPSKVLMVRGGAGPLNADMTAKAATIFFGAYGSMILLAPSKVSEGYGLPEATPESLLASRKAGIAIISVGLAASCRLFLRTSVNTAVSVSLLPRIFDCYSFLATNDKRQQFHYARSFEFFNLILLETLAFVMSLDLKYATASVYLVAIWTLVNGLCLALDPNGMVGKLHGVSKDTNNVLTLQWKTVGYDLLWLGVLIFSLGMSVCDTKAVGRSWCVGLVFLLDVMFVSKDVQKINIPIGPLYVWLLMEAIVIGTLAI